MQRYCLFTSPIHFLSFLCHLPKFNSSGTIPIKADTTTPLHIPNFPAIPPFDLPPSQHESIGKPDSHLFLLNEAERLFEGAGVVVNSVRELEEEVLAGLEQYVKEIFPMAKAPVCSYGTSSFYWKALVVARIELLFVSLSIVSLSTSTTHVSSLCSALSRSSRSSQWGHYAKAQANPTSPKTKTAGYKTLKSPRPSPG